MKSWEQKLTFVEDAGVCNKDDWAGGVECLFKPVGTSGLGQVKIPGYFTLTINWTRNAHALHKLFQSGLHVLGRHVRDISEECLLHCDGFSCLLCSCLLGRRGTDGEQQINRLVKKASSILDSPPDPIEMLGGDLVHYGQHRSPA